jgi:hypothetical protein
VQLNNHPYRGGGEACDAGDVAVSYTNNRLIIDPSIIVVGTTSTFVAIVFLLAIGAFVGLAFILRRHPQCLAPPTTADYQQFSSIAGIRDGSSTDSMGWVPVEMVRD